MPNVVSLCAYRASAGFPRPSIGPEDLMALEEMEAEANAHRGVRCDAEPFEADDGTPYVAVTWCISGAMWFGQFVWDALEGAWTYIRMADPRPTLYARTLADLVRLVWSRRAEFLRAFMLTTPTPGGVATA
jgi:hypothetical protein